MDLEWKHDKFEELVANESHSNSKKDRQPHKTLPKTATEKTDNSNSNSNIGNKSQDNQKFLNEKNIHKEGSGRNSQNRQNKKVETNNSQDIRKNKHRGPSSPTSTKVETSSHSNIKSEDVVKSIETIEPTESQASTEVDPAMKQETTRLNPAAKEFQPMINSKSADEQNSESMPTEFPQPENPSDSSYKVRGRGRGGNRNHNRGYTQPYIYTDASPLPPPYIPNSYMTANSAFSSGVIYVPDGMQIQMTHPPMMIPNQASWYDATAAPQVYYPTYPNYVVAAEVDAVNSEIS